MVVIHQTLQRVLVNQTLVKTEEHALLMEINSHVDVRSGSLVKHVQH